MNIKSLALEKARKHWYLVVLMFIVILGFWVRSFPVRYNELQAIDPFYQYRMSEYVLTHNFQLPEKDMMRHYPFGVDPRTNTPIPFYLPVFIYVLAGQFSGMDYFHFALLYPAIMGALASIIMFFIGKELFDRKTGLMAAFFIATIPAFITRTSAGFFDKEASAAVLMPLIFYFFIRAYKRNSWKSGMLGGISMFLLTETWAGGMQYITLLFPAFVLIMLLLNKNIDRVSKAFLPVVAGALLTLPLPYHPNLLGFTIYTTLPITGVILLIRMGAERFGLVKKEHINYLIPGILIIGLLGFLFSSMVTDTGAAYLAEVIKVVSLQRGTVFSTVAEAIPGSWGAIEGVTKASYGTKLLSLPDFAINMLSITTFMVLGMLLSSLVIIMKLYKTKDVGKIDFMLLFTLLWMLSSIWAVFGYVRLLFMLGPPAALFAAYFLKELIDYAKKTKVMKEAGFIEKIEDAIHDRPGWKRRINYVSVPLSIFLVLVIVMNVANAYAYGMALGPSLNRYWKDAMNFLATETPENSNILSWWDFGYWFQTRGNRPTLTDGGFGKRDEVAWWFTADTKNWTDFEPWLKDKYHIDYILMDYTLPGKYGAISKISSDGEQIVGMLQFNPSQTYQQGNSTIYEYKAGPYALWLPMSSAGDRLTGTPMLLVSQNNQYYSKAYVNDFCTEKGIMRVGNEEQAVGGCVSITSFGVFYIPQEAEHTIFTSLMFMEGYDLPVEKVYDNQLIKIFRVIY